MRTALAMNDYVPSAWQQVKQGRLQNISKQGLCVYQHIVWLIKFTHGQVVRVAVLEQKAHDLQGPHV
jgi:hypothetical protein